MSFTETNDASRARLEAFVRGLTDEELRRPTPYGGTVAGLLHLVLGAARHGAAVALAGGRDNSQ
jgi:hypothetical protein